MSITTYCMKSLNFLSKEKYFVDANQKKKYQVKVENMHIVVEKNKRCSNHESKQEMMHEEIKIDINTSEKRGKCFNLDTGIKA